MGHEEEPEGVGGVLRGKRRIFRVLAAFLLALLLGAGPAVPVRGVPMQDAMALFGRDAGAVRSLQDGLPAQSGKGRVVLAGVGDIMVHRPQYYAQRIAPGQYDFRNNFLHVRRILKGSDLVMGNLETTILPGRELSSFPRFNSPPEILDALSYAGFHMLSTINNHSLDTGTPGVYSTLREVEARGIIPLGTHRETTDRKYEVLVLEGMTFGIAAFASGYHVGREVNLNGIHSQGLEGRLNVMDAYSVDRAFLDVKTQLDKMKAEGCEFLVLHLHWGWEYHREPNAYQKRLAQMLVDEGVDLIIGAHPHMVQSVEFLPSSDGEREGLVAYSLGNFLSNQRREILGVEGTEYGAILLATVERDIQGKPKVSKAEYIPTWVHLYQEGGRSIYEIVPIAAPYEQVARAFGAEAVKLKRVFEFTEMVMHDSRVTAHEGFLRGLFFQEDILLSGDGTFAVLSR